MTQTPPYQVADPATGEVVQTYPHATDTEVEAALDASAAAFETWRTLPITERASIVKRVGALFIERAAELGALVTREMGKRPSSARGEAAYSSTIFDYYADNGQACNSNGIKRSGFGRELGPLGVHEFVSQRLFYVHQR